MIRRPPRSTLFPYTTLFRSRSGRMKFLHYATSDVHVRVYGNAAVVTGRLQRTRTLNGNEISDDWRFTDRKSTRLNSSHSQISYAVFCLKKKIMNVTTSLLNYSHTSH